MLAEHFLMPDGCCNVYIEITGFILPLYRDLECINFGRHRLPRIHSPWYKSVPSRHLATTLFSLVRSFLIPPSSSIQIVINSDTFVLATEYSECAAVCLLVWHA